VGTVGWRGEVNAKTGKASHRGRRGPEEGSDDDANRTQAISLCYFTPSHRHPECTALVPGMALRDRSIVQKAYAKLARRLVTLGSWSLRQVLFGDRSILRRVSVA
jgi:hypothetical protein